LDSIHIEPYDPLWATKFAIERDFIAACFETAPLVIEHIGSTAVRGLAAKPVIDIGVLVDELETGSAAVPMLEAGGYSYWRDNPDKSKLFLVKGLPPAAAQRTHHLHIYADPARLQRQLVFRDRLRVDRDLRDAYQALKHDLASRYANNREAYTEAKSEFIARAVRNLEAKRPPPALE
jgi:GrpB-like predicted nucleotidyltransferase (UPF0157 family)